MKIKTVPLEKLQPYWRNPRNNEPAVQAVKASIERYGFNSPIIIDPKNVIIAGHTRFKALLELGWTEAPCVTLDISPEKAKEYRIADNKCSELAEWDMTNLIPELREIVDLAAMQPFWPDANLDDLLQETATIAPVTSADITKRAAELESKFETRSDIVQGNYVELLCPHCAEVFIVDRSELAKQPAKHSAE